MLNVFVLKPMKLTVTRAPKCKQKCVLYFSVDALNFCLLEKVLEGLLNCSSEIIKQNLSRKEHLF